jgi:hypothetical protein
MSRRGYQSSTVQLSQHQRWMLCVSRFLLILLQYHVTLCFSRCEFFCDITMLFKSSVGECVFLLLFLFVFFQHPSSSLISMCLLLGGVPGYKYKKRDCTLGFFNCKDNSAYCFVVNGILFSLIGSQIVFDVFLLLFLPIFNLLYLLFKEMYSNQSWTIITLKLEGSVHPLVRVHTHTHTYTHTHTHTHTHTQMSPLSERKNVRLLMILPLHRAV